MMAKFYVTTWYAGVRDAFMIETTMSESQVRDFYKTTADRVVVKPLGKGMF